MKPFGKKNEVLKEEVRKLDSRLAKLDPVTDKSEYTTVLYIRRLLQEQLSGNGALSKIDPNMILRVAATLGVAGLIMLFESYGHIFTSKASAFMPKIL